jgi:hypothetical protein
VNPACPEICICVRQTLDWGNEAVVQAQLIRDFRPKYALWNGTFNIPYHRFRERLKAIAEATLVRVEGARLVPPADVPAGALVVPVDDDDWLAPELAVRLREAWDGSARGFSWRSHILEARPPGNPVRWLLSRVRPVVPAPDGSRFTCASNNYAFVAAGDVQDLMRSHPQASRSFDADPAAVRRLPLALSLQNRNLSSQTVLGWGKPMIPRRSLLRRFRRYRSLYDRVALPGELAWARPCVAAMAELMRDLRPR